MYDVYGTNIFKLGNMKNKNRMNSYVTPYIDPIKMLRIFSLCNAKLGELCSLYKKYFIMILLNKGELCSPSFALQSEKLSERKFFY